MSKKINLDSLYRIFKSNIFIIFAFAILSVLSSVVLWKANFIGFAADIDFHLSRILELKNSIANGNGFPIVAINKFYQSGSAVMTMYPSFNLLPTVMLSFFVKSFVHLIFISFILRNFVGLLISFYSCYFFNKDRRISFLFSIIYTLSSMGLHYVFFSTDLGVSSSMACLPLVLFGTFELINHNAWKELSVGISLIILSHVITAVLAIALVISLIMINFGRIRNKVFIIAIIKSIVLISLITAVFWIPFIFISFGNQISMPNTPWPLTGIDFKTFVSSLFSNSPFSNYMSIGAFIGLIISVVNYKNMTSYSKQIFWISVALIIIASPFFPWNMLNNTFIRSTFQRPWRLNTIDQLLLCYLLAENVIKMCKRYKQVVIVLLSITISVIVVQLTEQRVVNDFFTNNRYDFNRVIYDNQGLIPDYLTKNSSNVVDRINQHQVTYDNHQSNVNLLGNGKFEFKLNKPIKSVKIPFIMYNNVKYQIKLDGKSISYHADKHSQLTLRHMNKGKHTVQVILHKSWYDYLSYVLSTLGVIILAFAWIKSLILKLKK